MSLLKIFLINEVFSCLSNTEMIEYKNKAWMEGFKMGILSTILAVVVILLLTLILF